MFTGATALFHFEIWKCTGISTKGSAAANEARFHQCKIYSAEHSMYPAQLEMQENPSIATRMGTAVFMASVSYGGGDTKGAMYASEFAPNETYQLDDNEAVTGGYVCQSYRSLTLKTIKVDFNLEQKADMVSLDQPTTYFKVQNKSAVV
jgi:hypothetical protein